MPTKLGQNFLKDKSVVKKIIDSADLQPDDFVIEIGPGEGVLTEKLAKYAKKVVAIEIDRNLADKLQKKFQNKPNIEIVNEDILKINLPELFKRYNLQTTNYKLIANLPYYITSPIIRLFLEIKIQPKEMILMVQKEVAQRIVEKPGKMSILAISVQYYAHPEILFEIKKEAFEPIPQVDSAVIKISNIKSPAPNSSFFRLVRAGFCAKRKTLANNLLNSLHLDKKEVEEKLKNIGLTSTTRAQELSIADWQKILKIL